MLSALFRWLVSHASATISYGRVHAVHCVWPVVKSALGISTSGIIARLTTIAEIASLLQIKCIRVTNVMKRITSRPEGLGENKTDRRDKEMLGTAVQKLKSELAWT